MRRTRPGALLLCVLLPPGAAGAGDLLPDVSVHLKAARYVPTATDFHWVGWVGAGAGLVRAREVTAYFTSDVETIIGNTLRAFEANQSNFHLEAGLRRPVGRGSVAVFFHHVSRHYVDRPKVQAVDWNVLGVRASAPFRAAGVEGTATVSLGHTTLASLVGYRFEVTAAVDAEPLRRGATSLYVGVAGRGVTVDVSPRTLPRGGFLDLTAEGGIRARRDERVLDLFASFEHRNDVLLESPGARDRGLVGFRIRFGRNPL